MGLASAGCRVDADARTLTLRSAIAPTSDCSFLASNAPLTEGYYDPWVNRGQGATFAFVVENFSSAADDELIGDLPAVSNVETHRHDAQIQSVEGCWVVSNALDAPDYKLQQDGRVVDCASLPAAQRRINFLGVTSDEGKSSTSVVVSLLDLTDMRALFGAGFDPGRIPVVGLGLSDSVADNPSLAGRAQPNAAAYAYSYAPSSPADLASRSAAWGASYPTSPQARVLLQLRVRARMLSGAVRHSNWLVLPVTICPGCLRDSCGTLVEKVCGRGPCTDGTPCMADGTCAAGAPVYCTPITLFSGKVADFAAPGACLPAQAYPGTTGAACVAVGCDQQ